MIHGVSHGTSVIRKFFPPPPHLIKPPDITPSKSGRVLTSAEFRKQLKEKECIKRQKLEEKEKRRQERERKKEEKKVKKKGKALMLESTKINVLNFRYKYYTRSHRKF